MNEQQPMYDKDGLPISQPTSQFQGFGQYGQAGQFGQGSPYGQPQMQQFAPAQMQSAYGYAVPQKTSSSRRRCSSSLARLASVTST